MKLRRLIFPTIARVVHQQYKHDSSRLIDEQRKLFLHLTNQIQQTSYGKDLNLTKLVNYEDYRKNIPPQHYSNFEPYIQRATQGEPHVLWPGVPKAFALTSGTTSGQKLIPLTVDSLKSQQRGRMIAVANYAIKYNQWNHLNGPLLYFTGHSTPTKVGNFDANLVSSLLINQVPNWYRRLNLPNAQVADTIDFSERMDLMVHEALKNRTLIRGIVAFPPWLNHFLDLVEAETSQKFHELFPNFSLLVTSGVSYNSYKHKISRQLGGNFDRIETYPTSEGFIGFTSDRNEEGFSLLPNNGVFYEFVRIQELKKEYPERYWVDEVELGIEYAILLTTNSGLLSYVLGDTVKFISLSPPKMIITGRVNRSLSPLAEHVNVVQTDRCIALLAQQFNLTISAYMVTATPQEDSQLPQYRWIIACDRKPENQEAFIHQLEQNLQAENSLYNSFKLENLYQKTEILFVQSDAFIRYLKRNEALHFQHKTIPIQPDLFTFNTYYQYMLTQQHC